MFRRDLSRVERDQVQRSVVGGMGRFGEGTGYETTFMGMGGLRMTEPDFRDILTESLLYWEKLRVVYNVVLGLIVAVCLGVFFRVHFRS